jgi:hypothetical protein
LLSARGRERVTLNAALKAHCPTQVHIEESACVNAQSTRRLYEQLPAADPAGPPIYVVCDNARYYRNRGLTAWLTNKSLVQVFLPPYSLNLNLPGRARLFYPARRVWARNRVLIRPQLSPIRKALRDQFTIHKDVSYFT